MRVALVSDGVGEQECYDGHEKIGEQALGLGPGVGLSYYGAKEKFSGFVRRLTVMPNVRKADAIGHWYRDLIIKNDCELSNYVHHDQLITVRRIDLIPLKIVTDKGSETGLMRRIHEDLR